MNPGVNFLDFWVWSKEDVMLAFFAGIAFAVGDTLVRAIIGVYKKRRATSAPASDR